MNHFSFAFDDRTICETCLTAEATRQDEVHGHDYCEGCWLQGTATDLDLDTAEAIADALELEPVANRAIKVNWL